MLNRIHISPERQKLIIYIVLLLATFAVFWQVNQYDFVKFDDQIYVTQNRHVQSGITLGGIRWAFSTTYAEFWHPLTWLSLMFDYQLFGLNAGGYHLTNLFLHIISTLLLFRLFNRMTGATWKSAFVAALFALHPLQVESVAWIAERKDVLSAFFWMLTFCLYVHYTEKPVIKRYLIVLFCFACGLMSKSMIVTLPVVMILLDYWPLGRFESKQSNLISWQLREKTPFFILSAFFSFVTLFPRYYTPSVKYISFPLSFRLANAPVSFMTYLEKTFWPHDMSVFYPFHAQIPLGQALGITILIIVISIAVIAAVKHSPYLFVGWLWYAITLLPVIGIIPVGDATMADRYHYLPSIGLAVMLAWGAPALIKNEGLRKNILFPAAIICLIILSVLTWKQCSYWKNSITLFSHALQATNDNYLAHDGLALALAEEGKTHEAIYHLNKTISIRPSYADAYNNRGMAYYVLGQYQRAIEDCNKAIHLKPDSADAFSNRGAAYYVLGQYQRAIEDYNEAIHLKPDSASAYNNRGSVYAKLGQVQSAIKDFNKAIHLKPDFADAYNNRALLYLNQGKINLGCYDAQKACELKNCRILERARNKGYCR